MQTCPEILVARITVLECGFKISERRGLLENATSVKTWVEPRAPAWSPPRLCDAEYPHLEFTWPNKMGKQPGSGCIPDTNEARECPQQSI